MVGDASHKRGFRTYDNHLNAVVDDEFADVGEVVDFEVYIDAAL